MTLLLSIIYLAFISLGLPDALLGSAWPGMHGEMGVPVSYAGIVSMIISCGTIVSSLLSDKLTSKLGAGKVTAISVGMTCVALFGFSMSSSFWQLCVIAIPYGLGAGAVDAALNNYVALHYAARHMSWLHCFWGVGATLGPYVMGACLTGGFRWNAGYQVIAVLQLVLTVILFATLSLWKNPGNQGEAEETVERENLTVMEILQKPGVKEVLLAFFCYCALEQTTGMWATSYMVMARGMAEEIAAKWASIFYLGITVGRFLCGFITMKLDDKGMIRLGQMVALAGIVLVLLPLGQMTLCVGLILIGMGCAPVYPSLIHATPANFGPGLSQAVIGMQMAFAYVGSTLMPPLFGLIAQHVSVELYPIYLLVLLVLMIVMAEKLNRAPKYGESRIS